MEVLAHAAPWAVGVLLFNVGFVSGMWISRQLLSNHRRGQSLVRIVDALANNNPNRSATWRRRLQLN